jgi:endonuclease-8
MPEGDTIHRLAARLRPVLEGREVVSLRAQRIPDAAADEIVGRRIIGVVARGKNFLVRFERDRVLHVHLRMNGRIFVERPRSAFWKPRSGTETPSLRLVVPGAVVVGRDLPVCRLLTAGQEARALAELGPDLLAEDFDEDRAVARLRAGGASREIGVALLDQSALAGIGNVYKSEVLFLEGIHPTTRVADLDEATLRAAVRRARGLLAQNAQKSGGGPRTTRRSLAGSKAWVYGRAGRPCLRCGGTVESVRQGGGAGRSTYFCPTCQAKGSR